MIEHLLTCPVCGKDIVAPASRRQTYLSIPKHTHRRGRYDEAGWYCVGEKESVRVVAWRRVARKAKGG